MDISSTTQSAESFGNQMSELAFDCPLCGGDRYRQVIELPDIVSRAVPGSFEAVACQGCGLLRLHPQPGAKVLAAAYDAGYVPHTRRGIAKQLAEQMMVRSHWDYLRPPRRIVDVGCGSGGLLDAIRRRGNGDVLGIDPDEGAVEVVRSRGIDAMAGTLIDAQLPEASVAAVIMQHALEHVPRPDETLAAARRVLITGGAVIIGVPNVDSWAARVMGSRWIGYDAPRHLTTFSQATLSSLLERSGFHVVKIEHEWSGMEWAWWLRLLAHDYLPALEEPLRKIHLATMAAATPLGVLAARQRRSGRIIVTAVKQPEPTSALE